jgi:SAM-dependent methyltransferase
MNCKLLTMKILQSLRQDGFMATLHKCLSNWKYNCSSSNDFDRRYGTDTGGIEHLWKYKIGSPNARFGASYQATQEQELADAIDFLHEDLQTFTFVDLGCGKGRTLLVASNLGFKQVLGVEFVLELAEIAKANLAKMQIANAAVMHADAAEVQFSNNDTVVYLYNPFSEEVLGKVCENLREGCLKRLYVIYKVPRCAEIFDSSRFLTRFGSPPASPNIQIWRAVDKMAEYGPNHESVTMTKSPAENYFLPKLASETNSIFNVDKL